MAAEMIGAGAGGALSAHLARQLEETREYMTAAQRRYVERMEFAESLPSRWAGVPAGLLEALGNVACLAGCVVLAYYGKYPLAALLLSLVVGGFLLGRRSRKSLAGARAEYQRRFEAWVEERGPDELRRGLAEDRADGGGRVSLDDIRRAMIGEFFAPLDRRFRRFERPFTRAEFDDELAAGTRCRPEYVRGLLDEMGGLLGRDRAAWFTVAVRRAECVAERGPATLVGVRADLDLVGTVSRWYYVGEGAP
jgi:hypothetical protein